MLNIDIIIPVHNAPEATIECINSVFKSVDDESYCELIVYDDASGKYTRDMLEGINHPKLKVIFGKKNIGFGQAVNNAVNHAKSEFVFIINSDTEFLSDILPTLNRSLQLLNDFAVLNPISARERNEFKEYLSKNNVVESAYMSGYAMFFRRKIFLEIGGFESKYGRGYFEDDSLSRQLYQKGWKVGIQKNCVLPHKLSQSFVDEDKKLLMKKNRELFFQQYPQAMKKLLVVIPKAKRYSDLNKKLQSTIEETVKNGGKVYLFSGKKFQELPTIQMKPYKLSYLRLANFIRRTVFRANRGVDRKLTDIICAESPGISKILNIICANRVSLKNL